MIDFDIAKTWHKIFADQLEFVAAGLIPMPPLERVSDDAACKLGQWLYGSGKCMNELPAYSTLMNRHGRFHQTAYDYLKITLGEVSEELKKQAETDFRNASADVIAAIDELQDAVNSDGEDAAFLSAFPIATGEGQVNWDEALSIGLPAIDEQHQAIARILNKLLKNPGAPLHSESTVDNLTDLTKILDLHFSVEEAYMRKLGMPEEEFLAHRQRHTDILEQCSELNISAYAKKGLKVKDVAWQIRQWAIDHVIEYDFDIKKYVAVVAECGGEAR